MSNIKKYMEMASARVNESFVGADGFFDDEMSFAGDGVFSYADGMSAAAPTSQPYIVVVTNNSGVAVSNFDILYAYQYLFGGATTTINGTSVTGTFSASGNLTLAGSGIDVTISSGIPNVTYRQLLQQTINNPFSVGLTYLQSTTSGQVLSTLNLTTKDANGNTAQKPLIPTIDPYQQQTNIVAMRQMYRIDGYTGLTLNTLFASAVANIYLYPSDNINLARGLAGKPVSRQFGNPGIVKAQTIKIA
jgi:hypothetical protein